MYSARKLDAEVWVGLVERLQDRGFIARQIAAHRQEDTTAGELAAVDRALADVERRQRNTARAVALLDDPDAGAPLVAELAGLAKQRQALDARRSGLLAQRAAWEEQGRLLADLASWCETWRGNLNTADYALRRKILAALALTVELYPASHTPPYIVRTDWSAALQGGADAIVSPSTWTTRPPTGTR